MREARTIRTSEQGWMAALSKAYKDQVAVNLVDDANTGIDPESQTLFEMARVAKLSTGEIAAACIACGMATTGVGLVILAFVDPEPTSKLALMILSGAFLIFSGGSSAIYVLAKRKPPNVKASPRGVEICWA